jgi:molecular chaperone HscB
MSDPFDFFSIEPRFDLDESGLQRRFIELSAAHHPDRFTDPHEQALAAERSAEVNEAYRILRDPESRANALLRRLGGSTSSDDKSLPPDLLMEMMEVRERQEQAQSTGDAATLAELRQWAADQRHQRAAAASPPDRPPLLDATRLELNALRYIERMIEQLPHE